jgi:hypothetical protein
VVFERLDLVFEFVALKEDDTKDSKPSAKKEEATA